MKLQFIHDNKGNATGDYISIEEWQNLKNKYVGLQSEEAQSLSELPRCRKTSAGRLVTYK